MSCSAKSLDPDSLAPERVASERSQLRCLTSMYCALFVGKTAAVSDKEFKRLRIVRGAPLDIDNLGARDPGDASALFFSPCDWAQESLEWESDWEGNYPFSKWMVFDDEYRECHIPPPPFSGHDGFVWFKERLLALETILENEWQPPVRDKPESTRGEIVEELDRHIGLKLPWLHCRTYLFCGVWAYFVKAAADKPHSVCAVVDSSRPEEGVALRSEVLTAVIMIEFQVHGACYAHHFVKPVLVCTYFRMDVARLTQAHFDRRSNRLVVRQSRILDLTGKHPTPDAWLMLRWMACAPIGQTLYQPLTTLMPDASGGNRAKRAPQITVGV